MNLHDLIAPLQEATATMGWLEWAQLVGVAIVSWLGGHAVTRGQLR